MNTGVAVKNKMLNDGFATIEGVFAEAEIQHLEAIISRADTSGAAFRKSNHLFAIRQFFKAVPAAFPVVFNATLSSIIATLYGNEFFVVKSIYFDKPAGANWFVSWHQDLTISVAAKVEAEGFCQWTKKENQFAVQPPLPVLQDNFTIRIHLDDTTAANGALRVLPASHLNGICRPETVMQNDNLEETCNMKRRDIMLMKPLLFHSSGRTTHQQQRRVIHIEFSRTALPQGMQWAERLAGNPARG